jgi:hypothetical protein
VVRYFVARFLKMKSAKTGFRVLIEEDTDESSNSNNF